MLLLASSAALIPAEFLFCEYSVRRTWRILYPRGEVGELSVQLEARTREATEAADLRDQVPALQTASGHRVRLAFE